MSIPDITTLQKSMMDQESIKPFTEKQVLFISDTNGNSYNGSITFDTTVLSNSGRYLDYSDATIEVPITLSMQSTTDVTANVNAYMLGLKSGYHQLIDSIQVDYQNKNVVQQQSFTNFYVSYKIHSEWSSDDLQKYGDLTGVWPDSAASFVRAAAANARGDGISNNSPYTLATKTYTAAVSLDQANEGLRERIENTADPATGYGNLPTMTTVDQRNAAGKSYFTNNAGAAAARVYIFYVIATIRLKDVCDFFDKIPLLKGAQIRMTINYNASRCTVTSVTAGPTMALTTTTQLAGRTVPFMICDSTATAPMGPVIATAGNGVYTFEYNVQRTVNPVAAANPLISSCRLFVPAYTMSPDIEAKYLSSNPIKTIMYDDIYQFTVADVQNNASFNAILTNGILNPQKLVIIPFVNGNSNGATVFDEFRSPFDSAPATTGPLISLTNFQVQVSGKNMFDHPVNYDFEMFANEVAKSGINGASTTGLSSGLITKKMFDNGYRYYVCDLARRLQSADSIPLSVQISGTNNTTARVDLYCFVTYQRSLQIETASGIIVQ
jgi:hypothetical protein